MKTDTLEIEILADGTIKVSADKVSLPNHSSAEQFVREVAREAGGTTTRKSKHRHGTHGHHTHEGEHESHGH